MMTRNHGSPTYNERLMPPFRADAPHGPVADTPPLSDEAAKALLADIEAIQMPVTQLSEVRHYLRLAMKANSAILWPERNYVSDVLVSLIATVDAERGDGV